MLYSETFLGVANVNVTNLLGNSHYFVDKSGCREKLNGIAIEHNADPLSPTSAFEVTLTFSVVTLR